MWSNACPQKVTHFLKTQKHMIVLKPTPISFSATSATPHSASPASVPVPYSNGAPVKDLEAIRAQITITDLVRLIDFQSHSHTRCALGRHRKACPRSDVRFQQSQAIAGAPPLPPIGQTYLGTDAPVARETHAEGPINGGSQGAPRHGWCDLCTIRALEDRSRGDDLT